MKRTLALSVLLASAGCFKPPPIVMVDRATALEQQAAGSFDDLERRLNRSSIEPHPVPLTPEQLATLGVRPAPPVEGADVTDADRTDGLLLQHCVGEGKDGLLVDTREACKGAADPDELETLIDRTNRARRQLWRWMHEQHPAKSVDEMQSGWHDAHLRGVICGGWIEVSDGKWQGKEC
jgi:hypothetical protein